MIQGIQEGYYTLKDDQGADNGYVCLSYLGTRLEVRVRIDRNPNAGVPYEGYFTGHPGTVPVGQMILQLPAYAKGSSPCGSGSIQLAQWTPIEGSIDFTLFNSTKPVLHAEIYTAPERETPPEDTHEEEMQEEDTAEEEQTEKWDTEVESEPEGTPELEPFDPFNTTNTAYQWWLCQSHTEFHELMAQTGIVPGPPLYTALSSAVVRFNHFLFGRYQENGSDTLPGRTLLIFGIPVSGNSIVPDQSNARWIPAQNKVSGNLDYAGYWLYYFDAETGKAVRAVIRR